ncbi:MAG: 2-oxo-4-hydroxy-4-carboxy-5-ureidoimidazoline decarboxylase [Actinomycetota bacterium]|nr:2-oxo-4-hydroxy-4-carboxy-5-ureidoimidazoline decarboxylase [Actinomycetota bacterium]
MTVMTGLSIEDFNVLDEPEAEAALLACCSSPEWARRVLDGRPYADAEELFVAANVALSLLSDEQLAAALAGHPRIGERPEGGRSAAWSRQEQSGVDEADADLRRELREGNRAYEERFGHVYLVCATGKNGEEMLELLHRRLRNSPEEEQAVLREELRRINRLRLERLLSA